MTLEELLTHQDDHFTVGGWSDGIAFYFHSLQEEADEDTIWSGCYNQTGMVYMVMVGDDYKHLTDPEDVELLDEDAFCHCCGQVGCQWDGRDRS